MIENIMRRNIIRQGIMAGLLATAFVMPATAGYASARCANDSCVAGTSEFINIAGEQSDGGWIVLHGGRDKQPDKNTYRVEGRLLKIIVSGKVSLIRLPDYMQNTNKVKLINENNNLFVEYEGDTLTRLWCGRLVEYHEEKGHPTMAYFMPFYRIKNSKQIKNQYLTRYVGPVVAEMAGYKAIED